VALHVLVLALVVAFLRLGWWQVRRAGQGNPLSYGYALEWPVFAGFTVFVWYRSMRDSVEPPPAAPKRAAERFPVPTLPRRPEVATGEDDPALAAYNRYLEELARNDRHPG
jgi:DNA-binding transcriptional regulator of glucitol operon